MARTSRRHSYRRSRRWNPGVIGPKNAADRKLIRICTQGGSLSEAYALIRSGKCSADVAKEASRALGMVIRQLPGFARKAIKNATRSKSRKVRKSRKSKSRARLGRKLTRKQARALRKAAWRKMNASRRGKKARRASKSRSRSKARRR